MSDKALLIRNAHILDPASGLDGIGTIGIQDKKIVFISLGKDPSTPPSHHKDGWEVIDAGGLFLSPGFIDVHVHFRDPGLTYKEDIHTGASAAAAGGYTTVVAMANTRPPVDSVEVLSDLIKREADLPIHVLQAAAVTKGMKGEELTDFEALKAAGASAFTDDGIPIQDEGLLERALKEAGDLDLPLSLHEEDPLLMRGHGVNEGKVSSALGIGGAPAAAEEVLAARDIALNAAIGAKLDIQHVSSRGTVQIIRDAKKRGIRVFAEAAPHHLSATEDLVLKAGTLAKVNPPLRTEEDRLALIEGLKDGTIDMIATDHAPHSAEEKDRPFKDAPSGMIGLETAFGLVMTHAVLPGLLPLMTLIRCLTINPATLYGLSDRGRIREGAFADLTLFDPGKIWTVPKHFHSKAANSPFIGEELTGKVVCTIADGRIVYRDVRKEDR